MIIMIWECLGEFEKLPYRKRIVHDRHLSEEWIGKFMKKVREKC